MKRRAIRLIALLVIGALTFNGQVVLATGSSNLQDKINGNKQEIEKLEKEKNQVNEQSKSANADLETILKKVEAKNVELMASNKKVDSFQKNIDELQSQIDKVQADINRMDDEIKSKEEQIVKKEKESVEREEILGERLRNYYKNDMISQIMAMLINSDGLGSLISNIYNISKLINMDNNLLKEIKNIQEQLDKDKISLKEQIDKLDEEKEGIKVKQAELIEVQKGFIAEKNAVEAQMNELKSLENEKQRIANSLTQKERDIQEKIGDLNSYNQTLQNQMDQIFNDINNGSNVDSGASSGEGFIWPASGPISSKYGKRVHPITGANGFHTGIDIAAGSGAPIVASKSGTVAFSGVQSGYGNVVIIDHGGGVQTLYAHASALFVSKGQKVSRGQKIAAVGSTGNSTGPHLHFEVRINGKHTDPMGYL
ncbi:murein hydrolase activator EnvC family protein [Clostridium paraputrificum]|uniref:murein hydrolase activator EnvC family protein n=1 Tax=Clostridium TaxID=1485 RepID=UPI003D327F66